MSSSPPSPWQGQGSSQAVQPCSPAAKNLSPAWLCCQGPPSPGARVSPALEQTSSRLAPSSTSGQPFRAVGARMQNATEDQRGLLKCWALAAIPASCASKGICPVHPVDLITAVPQPGHSSALLQHPGDTQARRKEGSEPGVEVGDGFYWGIREHPALHKPQDRNCEVLERVQQN